MFLPSKTILLLYIHFPSIPFKVLPTKRDSSVPFFWPPGSTASWPGPASRSQGHVGAHAASRGAT